MSESDAKAEIKDKIKVLSDKEFFRPVAPPAEGGAPSLAFNFSYAGLPFHAEVEQGPTPSVSLTARLAPLPYSAESPELRVRILELIRDSGRMRRGRLVMDRKRELWLVGKAEAGVVASPVSILAATVAVILDMKPYLETMTRLFDQFHKGNAGPASEDEAEAAPAG